MKNLNTNGLSIREIANLLGMSKSHVAKIERRALKKMRAATKWRPEDVLDGVPSRKTARS